ncbi:hypothetical protein KI387_020613, partial [Taxus chinensis]
MVEEIYQDRKREKGTRGGKKEESSSSDIPKNDSLKSDFPSLKLDIKFELPMYTGELNVEKLDNWVKQIEVYCRVQRIVDDEAKIHLETLRMGGTTLIWWE